MREATDLTPRPAASRASIFPAAWAIYSPHGRAAGSRARTRYPAARLRPAAPGRRCASGSRACPWRKVLERLAPAIALGLGILSQEYAKHTIAFAPKAVALLVVAWALAAGLGEWLPEAKPDEPHARWRNFLRKAAAR